MNEPVPQPQPPMPTIRQKLQTYLNVPTVVALVALGIALWQWTDTRREASQLQGDLAKRVSALDQTGRDALLTADQVRNTLRDVESRMGMLEARLMETQSQRIALEALYQELARNRDEWVLAEVEGILTTAAQQLQLAGNVRAALIALEAADKRLARADRPSLIPLRKVINADIDRLKALPAVDVPGLTLKLDNLVVAVDSLPLAAEGRPDESTTEAPAAAGGFWSRLSGEYWRDLKELLRVRVVASPEVPLLAPEQAYFLRENLKLKLLSARLALLARDEATFRADLKTAGKWLAQYFDGKSKSVANATATLKQLGESELALKLPDLADSLEAVRSPRFARK
ncbi:MAG: uroporphyrinogen-III C-methyltransferase [Burkholderiales bacterium]|nr:uroporphyrinogen-III C-methyltransferase [Burkholderiales bacterium]